MKTAVFIDDDGEAQFVLTPETAVDKMLLESVPGEHHGQITARVYRGGFYKCQGGWVTQSVDRESLIIRLSELE